jgi:hypothetical protein
MKTCYCHNQLRGEEASILRAQNRLLRAIIKVYEALEERDKVTSEKGREIEQLDHLKGLF